MPKREKRNWPKHNNSASQFLFRRRLLHLPLPRHIHRHSTRRVGREERHHSRRVVDLSWFFKAPRGCRRCLPPLWHSASRRANEPTRRFWQQRKEVHRSKDGADRVAAAALMGESSHQAMMTSSFAMLLCRSLRRFVVCSYFGLQGPCFGQTVGGRDISSVPVFSLSLCGSAVHVTVIHSVSRYNIYAYTWDGGTGIPYMFFVLLFAFMILLVVTCGLVELVRGESWGERWRAKDAPKDP